MEDYSFRNSTLKIIDPSLNLYFQENFSPIRIPEKPKNYLLLKDDHLLQIYRHSNGGFEYIITKDKDLNGEYQLTYPDGKIKLRCFYNWGKIHGPSFFYSHKGDVLTNAWYILGKQTGKCWWYYPSQKIYSIQQYLENEWHGEQKFWYENGELKTVMEYTHGKLTGTVAVY